MFTLTTTISPEALMSLGRKGTPFREELVVYHQIKQQEQEQLQQLSSMEIHSGEIDPDVASIWSLPTDCTALMQGFLAAFSVIIVSELGDKTFIITAIMAMKNSRLPVFLASAFALLFMTILSVVMGVAVTVIPEVYTHYASIVLFICFGLKMLKEAYDLDDNNEESEFEEVKRSLEVADEDKEIEKEKERPAKDSSLSKEEQEESKNKVVSSSSDSEKLTTSPQSQDNKKEEGQTNLVKELVKSLHFAPLFIKVFTMIFVAEWGDRSQISTVILAAREDVVGVFVGSFIGHVLCTGLAVVGGRFVAEMISVRTMTLIGGLIFLLFATVEIISGP